MNRLRLGLVLCLGIAAAAPATASADPPQSPPGCTVVLTTPAVGTGSATALDKKMAAYERVCLS
jgi:hypothetical protein